MIRFPYYGLELIVDDLGGGTQPHPFTVACSRSSATGSVRITALDLEWGCFVLAVVAQSSLGAAHWELQSFNVGKVYKCWAGHRFYCLKERKK